MRQEVCQRLRSGGCCGEVSVEASVDHLRPMGVGFYWKNVLPWHQKLLLWRACDNVDNKQRVLWLSGCETMGQGGRGSVPVWSRGFAALAAEAGTGPGVAVAAYRRRYRTDARKDGLELQVVVVDRKAGIARRMECWRYR